ncbi:MAG TPA: M20/M25/M40 family metallo-hydrolase [Gemmatimonadales bacterium]|nr:M20/M25/M40 family metallo-hydrolase [Gemmatimonadales bacterium]
MHGSSGLKRRREARPAAPRARSGRGWVAGAALLGALSAAARLSAQDFEHRLLAIPDTASTRRMTFDLAATPHMAGTAAQAVTRDYVLAQMRAWGLETWTKEYTVYLPQPDTVAVWAIAGPGAAAQALVLREPVVAEDAGTRAPQVPPFNAYSGDGDVTADVVYVNYGLIDDYRILDSLGIAVRGKIALARYGRSFRGIKAREAERRGAAGLLIYSDPADDGYARGDVYPRGPMRPSGGVQRGSILNVNGDPTTPGYASLPGARRLPEESLPLPHIPVVPVSYGNAQRWLARLSGPSVPDAWQGGLPFRYHVGPGPARARLKVKTERGVRALHPIWDTFGMIRGARYPEEWVIVGAHRDAWGPGAADNVSGTVTVLEAARAFAALARDGLRPARTILFATWDAEEWGLTGSTEWVEEMADSLTAHAVAYVNEDDVTQGPRFAGSGSPSLKPLIREAARLVPDPAGAGSVYAAWLARTKGDTTALTLGNLGGGSDFAGFYHHLGVPAAEVGFQGPTGVYHSMYDSYHWVTAFGDPGYRAHRALAQLVGVIVARLANDDVLPLDYVAFGAELTRLVTPLDSAIAARGWSVRTQGLRDALGRFGDAARAFAAARDSSAADTAPSGLTLHAARVNAVLMQVERRLTRAEGLTSRPWYKSLTFASDVDNGYATMAFPSVSEAIRYADAATAERELADLAARLDEARAALVAARAALR